MSELGGVVVSTALQSGNDLELVPVGCHVALQLRHGCLAPELAHLTNKSESSLQVMWATQA